MGHVFHAGLRALQTRYGCIGDVRGRGLMAGMEIIGDPETKAMSSEMTTKLSDRMSEKGLWAQLGMREAFGGVFRIAPPITTSEGELEEGLRIMEEAFEETEGSLPLSGGRGGEVVERAAL